MVDLAGVAVSGLLKEILGKLGSAAYEQLGRIVGVNEELKKLESTLCAISAVLLDAEQQQSYNNSVSNWLTDLKDVVYDIEDVLDLISTEDLERKVNPRKFSRILTKSLSRYKLVKELKSIESRLHEIWDNRKKYHFQEQRALPTVVGNAQQRETHSVIQQSHVFGREEDKERVVSRLLSSSCHEVQQVSVIPVVGIGGMGKTTLAKLVCWDPRVIRHFDLKLWAYVSKNFDLKTVIENIVESATGQKFSNLNLETLQNKLRSSLTDKTFLLVLDDVWIEDSKEWMGLKELLDVGSNMSRIIVTTREEMVSSVVRTTKVAYKLECLSDEHCWSIFVKYAFEEHEEESYPQLVQIGKSMVRKCCGVPLAVKTLGSLLRSDRVEGSWKRIEESELWMLDQRPNDIFPALKLSFDHTPYRLKACFAFLALCAKGELIFRDQFIRYWMALGLLHPQEGTEIEDVGIKYFDELVSRSFFQIAGTSSADSAIMRYFEHFGRPDLLTIFRENWAVFDSWVLNYSKDCTGKLDLVEMHDLMHELAAYVAGKEVAVISSKGHEVSTRVRQIKCESECFTREEFPAGLLNASKPSTFLCKKPTVCLSKSFLEKILSKFKCLRILELGGCGLEELPDSIGDLKLLRLLNLRLNSKLKMLPNSTCKLVNLQCLDIIDCLELQELPRGVHKLVSLRWLGVTSKFTCWPEKGVRGWNSLQSLLIGNCPNLTSLTEEIGSLLNLRDLIIFKCDKLASLPNNLKNLRNLHRLEISEADELTLMGWEGLYGMQSLKSISFNYLPKLLDFPEGIASAAASLQSFRVGGCEGLRRLPEDLQLCTSLMTALLIDCENLSALPTGIDALKNIQLLQIGGCPNLSKRLKEERGDDWHLISHIPNIIIDWCAIQQKQELPGLP